VVVNGEHHLSTSIMEVINEFGLLADTNYINSCISVSMIVGLKLNDAYFKFNIFLLKKVKI